MKVTISLGYFFYIQVMSTNIADDQVVRDCASYVRRDNDKFAVRPVRSSSLMAAFDN